MAKVKRQHARSSCGVQPSASDQNQLSKIITKKSCYGAAADDDAQSIYWELMKIEHWLLAQSPVGFQQMIEIDEEEQARFQSNGLVGPNDWPRIPD